MSEIVKFSRIQVVALEKVSGGYDGIPAVTSATQVPFGTCSISLSRG